MSNYSRRGMLKAIGMGAVALTMPSTLFANEEKKHYITPSFDDGFKKSSIRTAEI
jgi:hypothetical protein